MTFSKRNRLSIDLSATRTQKKIKLKTVAQTPKGGSRVPQNQYQSNKNCMNPKKDGYLHGQARKGPLPPRSHGPSGRMHKSKAQKAEKIATETRLFGRAVGSVPHKPANFQLRSTWSWGTLAGVQSPVIRSKHIRFRGTHPSTIHQK